MAERAIFLDRDNTLIDNDGYLGDPTKVKLLTGAATALSAMRALGYHLIVVSNQSGVARGMFDEDAVEAVNQEMCRQLREQAGAHIDASYYCPYHPDAPLPEYKMDHEWRKPKPGMLLQAAADFGLDLSQSWTIGDMPRDIAAGAAAGTRTILLRDPAHPAPAHETDKLDVSPSFIVKTLADAARIIAREGKTLPHPARVAEASPKAVETAPATPGTAAAVAAVSAPVSEAVVENKVVPAAPLPAAAPAIARSASGQQAPNRLENALDELVNHMRRQNRAAELAPEFNGAHYGALIVEILAILALIVGVSDVVTAGATLKDWPLVVAAVTSLLRGIAWLLVAVGLQALVISLLLLARRK